IVGNFIGTTATGMAKASAPLTATGVRIDLSDITGNVIGGTAPKDRNIISGVDGSGIVIAGLSHQVLGNFIGVNALGDTAIPNGSITGGGITVAGSPDLSDPGAHDTKIGGTL